MFARASSNNEIQKTYRVYVTTDSFKQRSESSDPWKTTAGKGKEGTLYVSGYRIATLPEHLPH